MVSVRPRPADQPPRPDYTEDPSRERADHVLELAGRIRRAAP